VPNCFWAISTWAFPAAVTVWFESELSGKSVDSSSPLQWSSSFVKDITYRLAIKTIRRQWGLSQPKNIFEVFPSGDFIYCRFLPVNAILGVPEVGRRPFGFCEVLVMANVNIWQFRLPRFPAVVVSARFKGDPSVPAFFFYLGN